MNSKTIVKKVSTAVLIILAHFFHYNGSAQNLHLSNFDIKDGQVKAMSITKYHVIGAHLYSEKNELLFDSNGYLIEDKLYLDNNYETRISYNYLADSSKAIMKKFNSSGKQEGLDKTLYIYKTPIGIISDDLPETIKNDEGQYIVLGGLKYGAIFKYQKYVIVYELAESSNGKATVFYTSNYSYDGLKLHESYNQDDIRYFRYNDQNHLEEELGMSNIWESILYDYVYDEYGNWIKRTKFKASNYSGSKYQWNIDEVKYRTITYINGTISGNGTPTTPELAYSSNQGKLQDLPKLSDPILMSKSMKFLQDITRLRNDTKQGKAEATKNEVTTTCLNGDCSNGFGKADFGTYTIEGFFSNGKANGQGTLFYKDNSGYYQGNFVDGFRDGFGIYTWIDSKNYYIGQWAKGYQNGYGYIKNGGEILQAGKYEKGKLVQDFLTDDYKKKIARGNCVGDCQNGFGYYKFDNGDSYVGFFTNGKRDHVGAYSWKSGMAHIGTIVNEQHNGYGQEFYRPSGQYYLGDFSQGKRTGLGIFYNNEHKILQKGIWGDGQLTDEF
ncbi:MAG: hypothetical protein NXH86_14915 [Flavobacteriaceae bacterium]|uniref:MORN motif n=1 Tax=Flagellimonas alvinocaridis TaxID=2530200 RepID=A0A4S8RZP5_9FLAO|nr:hypothetical protein [Allomuricauda alvinocaridis]MCR9265445.1 hypothetical protein [Flavobacteriaceae bacterium]THV60989.1 hypothetical protein EZV76_01245 [Allomuricauda alvinocaridis]